MLAAQVMFANGLVAFSRMSADAAASRALTKEIRSIVAALRVWAGELGGALMMSAKEPPKTAPGTPTESCLPTASIRFWNTDLI